MLPFKVKASFKEFYDFFAGKDGKLHDVKEYAAYARWTTPACFPATFIEKWAKQQPLTLESFYAMIAEVHKEHGVAYDALLWVATERFARHQAFDGKETVDAKLIRGPMDLLLKNAKIDPDPMFTKHGGTPGGAGTLSVATVVAALKDAWTAARGSITFTDLLRALMPRGGRDRKPPPLTPGLPGSAAAGIVAARLAAANGTSAPASPRSDTAVQSSTGPDTVSRRAASPPHRAAGTSGPHTSETEPSSPAPSPVDPGPKQAAADAATTCNPDPQATATSRLVPSDAEAKPDCTRLSSPVDTNPMPVDLGRISQLFAAAAAAATLRHDVSHNDATRLAATTSLPPPTAAPNPQELAASEATAAACTALQQAATATAAFLKERHDGPHSQRLAHINEHIAALTHLLDTEVTGLQEVDALASQLDAQLAMLAHKNRVLRTIAAPRVGELEAAVRASDLRPERQQLPAHLRTTRDGHTHAVRMQSLFG